MTTQKHKSQNSRQTKSHLDEGRMNLRGSKNSLVSSNNKTADTQSPNVYDVGQEPVETRSSSGSSNAEFIEKILKEVHKKFFGIDRIKVTGDDRVKYAISLALAEKEKEVEKMLNYGNNTYKVNCELREQLASQSAEIKELKERIREAEITYLDDADTIKIEKRTVEILKQQLSSLKQKLLAELERLRSSRNLRALKSDKTESAIWWNNGIDAFATEFRLAIENMFEVGGGE